MRTISIYTGIEQYVRKWNETGMIKILMVEDDEMVCRSFQVAIHNNAAFSLAGKTGSQSEAMQMLLSMKVDVMLLDLELEEGDGMHLLEEMRAKLDRLPEIITVTNTSSESVLSCVRELGSDFVYQKHNGAYSPENVLEIIQMTFPYYKNKTSDHTQVLAAEYSMEKEREYQRVYIRKELEKIGFTTQKRGTYFLAEAISIGMENKERRKLQITNDIYPVVAERNGVSIGGVEKSIRDAIEYTWKEADMKKLILYYPYTWSEQIGRPTNAEFVSNMIEHLELK